MSDAFRAGLAESPLVQILSSRRPGVKTFVTGSVDTAAAGYSISVHLTRGPKADRPEPIAETATDSADLMKSLSQAMYPGCEMKNLTAEETRGLVEFSFNRLLSRFRKVQQLNA